MASEILTMEDLFLDEIRDLYDAEQQILKALPKMIKAAESPDLKAAFEGHLAQTQNQASRLEQIFNTFGEKSGGEKCDAMQGLLKEGDKLVDHTDAGAVRDAGLIAAAQRVEHYEMAGYGSARRFARARRSHRRAPTMHRTPGTAPVEIEATLARRAATGMAL